MAMLRRNFLTQCTKHVHKEKSYKYDSHLANYSKSFVF